MSPPPADVNAEARPAAPAGLAQPLLPREGAARDPRNWSATFSGLPLDLIKVVAAAAMAIDHCNVVVLDRQSVVFFQIGRLAFPLFCFALACHLHRGARLAAYVERLLLVGAFSQPLFIVAFGVKEAGTLFTLAAGATIAAALRRASPLVQHGVFACAVAAIVLPLLPEQIGVDYDVPGLLLPAAILLAMDGRASHWLWLALLFIGLNYYRDLPLAQVLLVAMVSAIGCGAAGALCAKFAGRARVLPASFFYAFYPAHLAALIALRAALGR